ncbi:LTA synthase family protein [Paenibacillus lautus]|uniref:LTA synthase family protein n=1 Tax=Paenibacillus lautus TaxID=1401 RepID=A0A385TH08_PAELA|nr:LTA synthase family protein [Paenibacillus lautus]AYB41924.1 LTA synthase family protein [Paenibacillus lautus]
MKKQLIYPIILFPLIVLIIVESIFLNGFSSFFHWLLHKPLNFFYEYLLVFSITNLFFFANKKIYRIISITIVCLLTILAFSSQIKFKYRGEIIKPSDLLLVNEASDISNYLDKNIYIDLAIYASIFIILSILIIMVKWEKPKLKISLSLSILSLCLLLFIPLFIIKPATNDELDPGVNSIGFVSGISANLVPKTTNHQVPDYTKERVNNIIDELPQYPIDESFHPNIIIVLSEAFWDPTEVKNIEFSEDPLPFYHSMSKKYSSGKILSPVYGGATANPEFESITGLSTRFIEESTPYVSVINRPLDSLASILSRQGYKSTVVHSYHNWFYNRPAVYKQMGFDQFISGEFFSNPTMKGPFMDDKDLFTKVVKEIENSPEPDFIYTISMLNHGPYKNDRYINVPEVVSGEISDQTKKTLNIYSHSLRSVDEALKQLISDLSKLKEPTIMVYFGDHLPLLGENYDVYKDIKFFAEDNELPEYLNKHSTSMFIWDNFGLEKESLGLNSPSFIGSYVLEKSKKKGNVIFDSLYKLRKQGITVIPEESYYRDLDLTSDDFSDFQMLQHDVLFGSDFSQTNKDLESKHVLLGHNITINSTNPSTIVADIKFNETDHESILGIQGEGFIPESAYFDFIKGSQIYINNKPYKTAFTDKKYISTIIPEELYKEPGELYIDVRVVDTKNTILSKSNQIILNIIDEKDLQPHINWVSPGEIKIEQFKQSNEILFDLSGEGFTLNSKVYINDAPVTTEFVNGTYIKFRIPEHFYKQPNVLNIEVQNTDHNKKSNNQIIYVTE